MEKVILKQFIRSFDPEIISNEYGISYKRIGRNPKIGVMVSTGPGKMGYSIISPKEDLNIKNFFDKKIPIKGKEKTVKSSKKVFSAKKVWAFGTDLAQQRSEGQSENPIILDKRILVQIEQFKSRMERYYKNK